MHDDGLHLGHNGIRNLCSIILSKLCKILSPANHYARDRLDQYRSTIDYIFLPNCLQDKIIFARTFDSDVYNTSTSDHQLIILKLNYHSTDVQLSAKPESVINLNKRLIGRNSTNHLYRLIMSPLFCLN